MEQFKTYVTTRELAELLDVEPRTVRHWANSNDSGYSRPLPSVKYVPYKYQRWEIIKVKHGLYFNLAQVYVWIAYKSKTSYRSMPRAMMICYQQLAFGMRSRDLNPPTDLSENCGLRRY